MSRVVRLVRFFKKLFVPVLDHDAAQEAERRKSIAQSISDDQIHLSTVRNALQVPEASIADKLTFALSSMPEATTDFPYAKELFLDILEYLEANREVSSEEANTLRTTIEDVSSVKELMLMSAAS
ncbi:MAG: hypothetical protein ACFFE8_14440 [Candidatus Heimdallarchaeota archaeon]